MSSIVIAMLLMFVVFISATLGFVVGKQLSVVQKDDSKESDVVMVKRNKASFRSPLKTTVTAYDQYRTSKGLYAPIKPGKGSKTDEIELKV